MSRQVVHFLSGLEVGGKERVAIQLARRARESGYEPELLLFDEPYRGESVDLDPGDLPLAFVPRGPGLDLRFVLALARRWRRTRPRVVHAHNDTAVFYACAAAACVGRRGPAVCATFHTKPGHDTPSARRLTRWAARRADRITAVSDELAGVLLRDRWVTRCDTLWNGVDLDEFSDRGPAGDWRARLEVPEGSLLVGHIARFDPIKRHVDLLAAARELAAAGVPAVVVLVGQGPLQEQVQSAAADCANVRFLPRVVDVPGFLRALDVFVLCSDHEAAPRVILEAMACGRPTVATDVGGVARILAAEAAEPAGVLVPARNPARLAAAIRALSEDEARRAGLGRWARARAAAFSAAEEWRQYAALYESAAAERGL